MCSDDTRTPQTDVLGFLGALREASAAAAAAASLPGVLMPTRMRGGVPSVLFVNMTSRCGEIICRADKQKE